MVDNISITIDNEESDDWMKALPSYGDEVRLHEELAKKHRQGKISKNGSTVTVRIKGGPGSGHHGHAGRPGKVGGSSPGEGIHYLTPKELQSVVRDISKDRGVKAKVNVYYGAGPGITAWFPTRDSAIEIIDEAINNTLYKRNEPYMDINDLWNVYVYQTEQKQISFTFRLKGGPGSGHHGHRGRPGKVGGSLPGSSSGPTSVAGGVKEVSGRVWTGERLERADKRISKLRTGEIGERIAAHVLSQQHDAQIVTLNEGINNAPIDLAGDHIAAEVKTGLASNGKSAQHWRATIGQPGPAERELLDGMSASEKRDYNNWKVVEILNRKYNTLALMGEQVGAEIRPVTVGIILHPNGNRGDVFLIPDFHSYLSWTQFATDEYYTGTYEIES